MENTASRTDRPPEQGSLFPQLSHFDLPGRARCWLVIPEIESFDLVLRALISRRHVVVDPQCGSDMIDGDDLVLLLDRRRQQLCYLGTRRLDAMLPSQLRRMGLGFHTLPRSDGRVVSFAEHRVARPFTAVEFRSGPAAPLARDLAWAPLNPLIRELQRMAEDAPNKTSDYLDHAAPTAPDLVRGLLGFEAGTMLMAEAAALDDDRLRHARHFFARAEQHMASAGHASALRACRIGRERVEALIFDRRQLLLELEPGQAGASDADASRGLGYRAHGLFALPLPAIPLENPGETASLEVPGRIVLFRKALRGGLLQRLLARSAVGPLTGSVEISGAMPSDVQRGLRSGALIQLSATLDTQLHHRAGVPSVSATDRVAIHADAASLDIRPTRRVARLGQSVQFGAIGRTPGDHKICFTFLTNGKVVSRIAKTVKILAE